MWTRFFPAMKQLRQLIAQGEIGRPLLVSGDFGWSTRGCDDGHRIFFPSSGGMILDVAMYMAQLGLVVYNDNEDTFGRTTAMGTTIQRQQSTPPVDDTTLVSCQFSKSKGFLQFYVTGQANTEERATIQGTEGRIVLEAHHIPSSLRVYKECGRVQSHIHEGDGARVLEFPLPDDSFTTWNHPSSIGLTYQVEAVGRALRNGELECPEYTWRESLEIAKLLEEIRGQVIGDEASSP
jgi:dihydrodiol dehydrogenase / D-xylose 1-dehydrogenase (NADP)